MVAEKLLLFQPTLLYAEFIFILGPQIEARRTKKLDKTIRRYWW